MNDITKPSGSQSEQTTEGLDRPFPMAGPIDIRSSALAILSLLGIIFTLSWARTVLVPLVLSLLVSYSLDPIVTGLARLKIPRALGAAVLLCGLLAVIGYGSLELRDQTEVMLDKIPEAVQRARMSLQFNQRYGEEGVIEKVQQAAEEIQKATAETASDPSPAPPGVTRVQIEQPSFSLSDYVWWGSMGILTLAGQAATILILVYFFLVSGDLYKRKLVKITGPTLSKKKITVQILDDFNMQIRLYLFVQLIGVVFTGVLTWAVFWWIGLEQAALWGTIAGFASLIPYLGPAVVFAGTAIDGFLQFGTAGMATGIGVASLVVASIHGYLLIPLLTSRATAINAVSVFVGLLFWGWLWGPVGLIVGTPILIIIKVCCDHIENLQPIGELLGSRTANRNNQA